MGLLFGRLKKILINFLISRRQILKLQEGNQEKLLKLAFPDY